MQTPWQRSSHRFRKNKPAVFGLGVIVAVALVAILAYLLAPDNSPDANQQYPALTLLPAGQTIQFLEVQFPVERPKTTVLTGIRSGFEPSYKKIPVSQYELKGDSILYEFSRTAEAGLRQGILANQLRYPNNLEESISSQTFWLGTDRFGRDLLSRLILGSRVSLIVGLIAVFISLTVGIVIGLVAGYFGGRVDDLLMLLINTLWSIPTLLLVFAIVLALGRSITIIFLAVGLTMWVDVARIVRGQVMSLKSIKFVEAAKSMGFGTSRILFRHMLPNILGPIMVIAAANFATAILLEAGLSYLGFGIRPPTPSWGTLLNENYGYAISGKPMLALVPALAVMFLVLAFNLLGNGLRDAFDVKE